MNGILIMHFLQRLEIKRSIKCPIDVKNHQPWSRLMIAKTEFLLLQKILKYFMHAKFNILNDQHTHSNLAMKIKDTINDTQVKRFSIVYNTM